MIKLLPVVILLSGLSFSAKAQMEVAVHGSVEIPLDELKWVFKPGTGVVATISKTKRYKTKGSAIGGSIGYSKFSPKEDLFYYYVSDTEVGTIRYEDMVSYQAAIQGRWEIIIKKKIDLFCGLELGIHYTKTAFVSHDPFQSVDSDSFVGRYVAAPKAGVNYMLTKKLGAYFQTRLALSLAKSDIRDDQVNTYWTNSLGMLYRF